MGLFKFIKKMVGNEKQNNLNSGQILKNKKIDVDSLIDVKVEFNTITADVIPIEKRIKGIKPNDVGLYPHEILLLSYAPRYYVDGNNEYPGFWWYKYGIKDVDKNLQSLLDRGFLSKGSLESAIRKETVAVLKDILRENNKKVSGKKEDLVQRLLDEVEEEKLKKIFTKYTFELTNAGEEVLKKEEYIPYIHRHSIENLDIFSLSKMVKERPNYNFSYRDVIWGYLNEKGMKHISDRNYGLYRNSRFTMSEFLKEEGKIDSSFALLSEVIRYDLSGLSNGFDMQHLWIYKDGYFPYEESIITMAPGIISRVVEYKEARQLSDDELKQKLLEEIEKIKLPFSIFTPDECVEIVMMEINKNEEGLKKIYIKAKKRFNKEYGF